MYPPILGLHLKKRSAKDLSSDSYAMFLWVCVCACVCVCGEGGGGGGGGGGYSDFLYKAHVVGTHLNRNDKSMQFKWVPTTYMPL